MSQVPQPSDTSSTSSAGQFRMNWTGSLMALAMCGLAAAGAWSHVKRAEAAKRLNEFRSTVEEGDRRARERFESGEDPYSPEQVDANLRAAKVFAKNTTGAEAIAMQAAIGAAEHIAAAQKTALAARTPVEIAGGLAPDTFQSQQDVRARMEGMKAFGRANTALKSEINQALAGMREQLRKGGLSAAQCEFSVSEFTRGGHLDQQFELIAIVNEIVEASLVYLQILHDQWGRWELSPADSIIVFEDDAALEQFSAATARITAGAEAEAEWHKRAFASVPASEK